MGISPNKRIALNVAATYGRSLVALVCGLFTGRWLLMALGETDYGLYGLIGGLAFFIAFFNTLLTGAVERFFAVAEGKGDLDENRRWFSVALMLHLVCAVVFVGAGYPVGRFLIGHYLAIPADRVEMCRQVFIFVTVDCFVGMVTVPFSALYVAKQKIAELTVYGLVQTLANVAVLGYMVTHPDVWLVVFAGWMCALRIVPALLIAARAAWVFPECRFDWHAAFDRQRIGQIGVFVGSRFICLLGQLFAGQGLAIAVNKQLGVARNAAVTVGNAVSNNISSLAAAMAGAFMPAIMNVAGAGDRDRMRSYAMRTCTFATLAILVFAVPLALEMDEVLTLWLVKPPEGAVMLCECLLAVAVLDRLTEGHWMAIAAVGDIRASQFCEALTFFGSFFLGWALMAAGMDILGMGLALIVGRLAGTGVKVWFGLRLAGLSIGRWTKTVLVPLAVSTGVALACGVLPRLILGPSFCRVLLTSAVALAALLPCVWALALLPEDRARLLEKVKSWRR